jgi:signal transduction histidine kinase
MPQTPRRTDVDLWAAERTPRWRVLPPLTVVIVALLALVVLPALITQRSEALREEMVERLNPLVASLSSLERATGTELGAARGYALTGDPFFVDRFLSVHAYANRVASNADSLASEIGGPVEEAMQNLLRTRDFWTEANFGRTRAQFREGLAEHQQHFDALMSAAQRVRSVLDREIEAHNQRIGDAERLRAQVTALLALAALLAAAAVLWLAQGLRSTNQLVFRRAREEATLRRIAQTMAEAEDLRTALHSIVAAVADMTAADQVVVKQIDAGEDRTEVVATAGDAAAEIGKLEPYAGSVSEQVLATEQAVLTGSESLAGIIGNGALAADAASRERVLGVPLLSEGESLGVMLLYRGAPKPAFDVAEARRIRLLADMAALALRHLGLFEEIRQKERALEITAEELRLLNENLEQRVRDRTQTIRELAQALTVAEERERQELAQILHDDLQQLLFALRLNLDTVETRVGNVAGAAAQEDFSQSRQIIAQAISITRQLTTDLSPPLESKKSLDEALRWLANHVQERFGLDVEVEVMGAISEPADEVRLLLFRITRELLFNAVKHSEAPGAKVGLSQPDGSLILMVADQGKGFDPGQLEQGDPKSTGSFGIRRARERLALFGGTLELQSEPGGGTRARVTVPVENQDLP